MSHELAKLLEEQKALLVSVATSGPRVQDKLDEYANRRAKIQELLKDAGLQDPIPFGNLWEWHARWTDGSLPTFSERRDYIARLVQPILDTLDHANFGPRDSRADSSLDVFISHSGRDRAIAANLANLLRSALNLPPDRIRCTSVDGYRLEVGADSVGRLRNETKQAKAFIALLTRNSLASQFVLFEMGARWGAGLHLAPVVAGGLSPGCLRPPLAGFNALDLTSRAQVFQLIQDLAQELSFPVVPIAAFDAGVAMLTEAAGQPIPEDQPTGQ